MIRRPLLVKGKVIIAPVILFILSLVLPASLYGQSGRRAIDTQADSKSQAPDQDEEILRVSTEEVLLPVSVRDSTGAPVSGLKQEDFLVFDNGVRQQLSSFNRKRVPARIVLLLDASGSVFSQMRFIRDAAKRFIKGLLEEDQLCVMQFADRVELLQDWAPAKSLQQLEKSVDWRYHPGLSTTFYDGLYLAAAEQLSKVEGRRIIILLTDGLDTSERVRASFADALDAVRRAEASVYVVSLTANLRAQLEKKAGDTKLRRLFSGYDPRDVARYLALIDNSEKLLGDLAAQTGGRMFLPLEDKDLAPAYAAIAEELRTQYLLTYRPQPRTKAGEFRQVRVLVSPGGYEVGARVGYTGRAQIN